MMQKLMLADIIDNFFTLIVSDNFKTQKLKKKVSPKFQ